EAETLLVWPVEIARARLCVASGRCRRNARALHDARSAYAGCIQLLVLPQRLVLFRLGQKRRLAGNLERSERRLSRRLLWRGSRRNEQRWPHQLRRDRLSARGGGRTLARDDGRRG